MIKYFCHANIKQYNYCKSLNKHILAAQYLDINLIVYINVYCFNYTKVFIYSICGPHIIRVWLVVSNLRILKYLLSTHNSKGKVLENSYLIVKQCNSHIRWSIEH